MPPQPASSDAGRAAPAAPAPVSPWRQALAAARANLIPGLALQVFALALVLAYYYHPPTHARLEALADLKARLGWTYSILATALFGGVLPFIYLRAIPVTRAVTPWSHGVFLVLFWAYKGLEVDAFYRLQGLMFGVDPSFATVAKKVAFDQLIYVVFWATPSAIILFHWKEQGFAAASAPPKLWTSLWRAHMPKALIATWAVWLPAVAIIYSLPATLQIPLFNVVLLFYSLLFATLTKK